MYRDPIQRNLGDTMDELSDSMFLPGHTRPRGHHQVSFADGLPPGTSPKRTPEENAILLRQQRIRGQESVESNVEFEQRKNKDWDSMNKQYHAMNEELNQLVDARNAQIEGNRILHQNLEEDRVKIRRESQRLNDELLKEANRANKCRVKWQGELEEDKNLAEAEHTRMLQIQSERQERENGLDQVKIIVAKTVDQRNREIAENENVRRDITDTNAQMIEYQEKLIREIAQLETQRLRSMQGGDLGQLGDTTVIAGSTDMKGRVDNSSTPKPPSTSGRNVSFSPFDGGTVGTQGRVNPNTTDNRGQGRSDQSINRNIPVVDGTRPKSNSGTSVTDSQTVTNTVPVSLDNRSVPSTGGQVATGGNNHTVSSQVATVAGSGNTHQGGSGNIQYQNQQSVNAHYMAQPHQVNPGYVSGGTPHWSQQQTAITLPGGNVLYANYPPTSTTQGMGNGGGGNVQHYPGYTPNTSLNTTVQSNTAVVKYNRRQSMSVGMQAVYDGNPGIAGLGLDCFSRTSDGSEVMSWSLQQSNRLRGAKNSARRVARIPKAYTGDGIWKDDFQKYLDDMECNGWTQEEALPYLVAWLNDGVGKMAVDQWRNEYGQCGNFSQLVQIASYLFGTLGTEDPMSKFRSRTQKPKENHKIFGLDLKNLLQRARPSWRADDEYFLQALFTQFVEGLRDREQQAVAYDAWNVNASLADLFLAIDNFNTKKTLMAGKIPQRVSAYLTTDRDSSEGESDSDEEEIGAVNFKGKYNRRSNSKNYSNQKKSEEGRSNSNTIKSSSNKTVVPTKEAVSAPTSPIGLTDNLVSEIINKLSATFSFGRRRQPVDKSTKRCYRCQVLGHYAAECTALTPVIRVSKDQTTVKPEN